MTEFQASCLLWILACICVSLAVGSVMISRALGDIATALRRTWPR